MAWIAVMCCESKTENREILHFLINTGTLQHSRNLSDNWLFTLLEATGRTAHTAGLK